MDNAGRWVGDGDGDMNVVDFFLSSVSELSSYCIYS